MGPRPQPEPRGRRRGTGPRCRRGSRSPSAPCRQFFIRRGGTFGSTRTTWPALSSQIRSSGKRIVNVCTERQRGMCSAVVSGMSSSFASPFMRAARECASATRSPPGRSRPGRPSRRDRARGARARRLSRCRTRRHCGASWRRLVASERGGAARRRVGRAGRRGGRTRRRRRPGRRRWRVALGCPCSWPAPGLQPGRCLACLAARRRRVAPRRPPRGCARRCVRSRVKSLAAAAAMAGSGVAVRASPRVAAARGRRRRLRRDRRRCLTAAGDGSADPPSRTVLASTTAPMPTAA